MFKLKKRKHLFALLAVFMLLLGAVYVYFVPSDDLGRGRAVYACHTVGDEPIYGDAYCLYRPATGEELHSCRSAEHHAPASTVKLLTALTAMDYCDYDEEVCVGGEISLIARDASRAWLKEGDRLSVRQLLYAMLLPSGNDAAYALATFCGNKLLSREDNRLDSYKQSVACFMEAMNEKAAALGAADSYFVNPDGYDNSRQYSTPQDLARIAAAFCADEELLAIASTFRIREQWLNGREVVYFNTNELLDVDSPYYYEPAVGLKTGTSGKAGACLIAAADINGELYIAVVLGSKEDKRFSDCLALFHSAE